MSTLAGKGASLRRGHHQGMALSPRELRRHREALVQFHSVYKRYIEDVLLPNGKATAKQEAKLRSQVFERMPAANVALNAIGVGIAFPNPSGPPLRGLGNTAFLHEQPGYRLYQWGGYKPPFMDVLECVSLAVHTAGDLIEHEERRRRNPLYWVHRTLELLLGFPAYILSLIFREPVSRFEEGSLGVVLRLIALAINAVGVFIAGRAAKVW